MGLESTTTRVANEYISRDRKLTLQSLGLNLDDVKIWRQKWQRVKFHAERRKLLCLLTFEDYVSLAVLAGIKTPDEIGVRSEQYQLSRLGDKGNYELGNCRFITAILNKKEMLVNGGFDSTVAKLTGRNKEEYLGNFNQSQKISSNYKVVSPSGGVYKGKNLKEFCNVHGLNRGNMSSVCRGDMNSYKGWTGEYING